MRMYRTPGVYFEQQDATPPLFGPVRTDVAGFAGIAERGPLHTAVKIESLQQYASVFGGKLAQAYLAYAIDAFFSNGGATCWIVRVADPNTAQTASLNITGAGGKLLLGLRAGSPGAWGNQILASWVARGEELLSLTLHYPDGSEQLIRNPLAAALPIGETDLDVERDSLPTTLDTPLIVLEKPQVAADAPAEVSVYAGQGQLRGGADGLATLTPAHFSGEDAPIDKIWGLAALELVPEVSIVAIPDIMPKPQISARVKLPPPPDCQSLTAPAPLPRPLPDATEFPPSFDDLQLYTLQEAVIRHCEKLRYRMAILDTKDLLVPDQAVSARNQFQDSCFAAIYYPWVLVNDPLELTGIVRAIPPSGGVAGIYANSDLQIGVHKPPANAVVEGALDVQFQVDQVVHGELNDSGVNVIRSYPGRGIRVFGARTLSRDPLWLYVNVRRLISMIEKAIEVNSQWTVFEPNDPRLRREMDRSIRSYLESLFRQGMLDGADSSAAYFVKCNDANNPPEAANAGRVICEIGVQPPYPAEFVVIVIGKTQNAIEVLQEAGAVNA